MAPDFHDYMCHEETILSKWPSPVVSFFLLLIYIFYPLNFVVIVILWRGFVHQRINL